MIAERLPAAPDELEGLCRIALLLAAQAVAGFVDAAEFAVELTIKQNKNSKVFLAVYGKSITFEPSYRYMTSIRVQRSSGLIARG